MGSVDVEEIGTFIAAVSGKRHQRHEERPELAHLGSPYPSFKEAAGRRSSPAADVRTETSYDTVVAGHPPPAAPSYTHSYQATGSPSSFSSHPSTQFHSSSGSTVFSRVGSAAMADYYSTTTMSTMESAMGQLDINDFGGMLVCEFRDLLGCSEVFGGDETEAWIDHISRDHLQRRFPARSVCWFCDNIMFDSGSQKENRRRCFAVRLRHVREHIVTDGLTYEQMRPDYLLMDHMLKHGLITRQSHSIATGFSEIPEPLRALRPKEARAHDWEPPERVRERERSSRQVHDQDKEDRRRRRNK